MARPSKKVNHKSLGDNQYSNKFNENITTLTTKFAEQVEFEIGSRAEYRGGIHTKGSLCTITKIVNQKSKVYYSVIFDGTDREVNFIMSKVLKKIEDNKNENTPTESEDTTNE